MGGGAEEVLSSTSSSTPLPVPELTRLRQAIYRLFGALFLYPDEDRLAKLRAAAEELQQEGDLWESFASPTSRAQAVSDPLRRLLAVLAGLSEEKHGQIEEEYVRLFLAKPAAAPYESFYIDPEGQIRGQIANDLEREYTVAGLALSPSLMDLPDHVAVELEFMSFLCGEEARAWEAKAHQDGVQARQRQRAFLGRHLGQWFPQFARRVREATPEHLYGAVVEAAYAFLRHELDLLRLRPKSKRDRGAES